MTFPAMLIENAAPSVPEYLQPTLFFLQEEFGIPFVLYEAATGERLPSENAIRAGEHDASRARQTVTPSALSGEPVVVPSSLGVYDIWIPLRGARKSTFVAAATLRGFARTEEEAEQEQHRLQKWIESVGVRLEFDAQRSAARKDSTGEVPAAAWEAVAALDSLLRKSRFLSDPAGNQRRILETISKLVGVEALVWVPDAKENDVVIAGACGLSPWDARQLAHSLAQGPDWRHTGMALDNDAAKREWARRLPAVCNLLALRVADPGMPGCLIALNKRVKAAAETATPLPPAQFRRSDAALVTPFLALMAAQFRAAARYRELKNSLVGLTRSLTAAIDAKDSYTYGHSERVARIAVELGRELDLQEEELSDIYLAGLLHDVGKIGIRDAVLCKQGPLTPEEFEHIKQHVTIGHQILADLHSIKHLLPGVLYHHERYDGKGYPHGLQGEEIPFLARILAVADSLDAMISNRPYRPALPFNRVEQIFDEGSGTQWDARVVEALRNCRERVYKIRERGVGASLKHALDDVLRQGSPDANESLLARKLKP
jgi:HD-GYP domain-containing protein (c-di-GMP phosphodiesterase class II)